MTKIYFSGFKKKPSSKYNMLLNAFPYILTSNFNILCSIRHHLSHHLIFKKGNLIEHLQNSAINPPTSGNTLFTRYQKKMKTASADTEEGIFYMTNSNGQSRQLQTSTSEEPILDSIWSYASSATPKITVSF